jgi:hypothetical protein
VIMRMQNLVEWRLAGETEVLEENLPLCHFVHQKSYMNWLGAKPGRRGGKPSTNRLSYGTAVTRYSNCNLFWSRNYLNYYFDFQHNLNHGSASRIFTLKQPTASLVWTDGMEFLVSTSFLNKYKRLTSTLGPQNFLFWPLHVRILFEIYFLLRGAEIYDRKIRSQARRFTQIRCHS